MARILALDYGKKRTGIAVTDPLQIIASPLITVDTDALVPFLKDYFANNEVELVIIGLPYNLDGTPTDNTARVEKFIGRFEKLFPLTPLKTVDETYTSKMASQTMVQAGIKKSDRQDKANLDKISAAIMLQEYLGIY